MVSESSVNKERKAGGAAAFVNTVILNKVFHYSLRSKMAFIFIISFFSIIYVFIHCLFGIIRNKQRKERQGSSTRIGLLSISTRLSCHFFLGETLAK